MPIGTGLHWAAYGGHVDIVRLLLAGNAPLEVRDKMHDATPMEWAAHALTNAESEAARGQLQQVIALLQQAAH